MLRIVTSGTALAVTALALAAAPAGTAGATPAHRPAVQAADRAARYKASHDTDPHQPLPPAARAGRRHRTEAALRQATAQRAEAATSRTLTGTQRPQQTSYWCGPAAVSGALAVRGVAVSQRTAASLLRTTSDGTDWSGTNAKVPKAYRTGYPVADVLTYKLRGQGAHYYPVWLDYNPTATQKARYRTRLVADIDRGWDLVGNAWEVPGGPHLVGHPGNQEIFHYFTIRGYTRSGTDTRYQDSVHGASSISWSSGVPAYSTMSSNTIAVIVGGRGYVW